VISVSASVGVWGQEYVDLDDVRLLALVRGGDSDAYAELWRRHLPAAYSVAHRNRGRASAEDIVGEASLRVYDLIRAGKGPTTNFRSYFLSTVKTVAVDHVRTDLRVVPTETEGLESVAPHAEAYDMSASVDHQLVRVAFGRLPERDQRVLWQTAVEGTSPAAVATSMGMTANGVSVVALRARDNLRAKYLDAHADRAIDRADDEECRWVLSQMGRFVRGKLPVRQRARVEDHLRSCRHAQGVAFEMAEVNRALPALMVPFIFMAGSSTATAVAGLAGAGGDSGKSREEPKALSLVALVGNVSSKAAALAVGLVLGVGFVAAPGGLDVLSTGGSGSTVAAGPGPAAGDAVASSSPAPSPAPTPGSTPSPPAPAPVLATPPASTPAPAAVSTGPTPAAQTGQTRRSATSPRTVHSGTTTSTPAATTPNPTTPNPTTPDPTTPNPTTPNPTTPDPTPSDPTTGTDGDGDHHGVRVTQPVALEYGTAFDVLVQTRPNTQTRVDLSIADGTLTAATSSPDWSCDSGSAPAVTCSGTKPVGRITVTPTAPAPAVLTSVVTVSVSSNGVTAVQTTTPIANKPQPQTQPETQTQTPAPAPQPQRD
jgi:RNA polymerase sigma factor (sigma-70 family)